MTEATKETNTDLGQQVSIILHGFQKNVPIDARQVLAENPEFLSDPKLVFDLAVAQFERALELGIPADADDYLQQFSEVSDPGELRDLLVTIAGLREASSDLPAMLIGDVVWPQPGDLFLDEFLLKRELGAGASSRVFLAEEVSAGQREVVVKVCVEGCGAGNEADILGPMSHPNIGAILSVRRNPSLCDNLYAICMRYEAEATLRDLISGRSDDEQGKRAHVERVIHIGERVADALDYTHKNGYLHGDVKPSNILVTDDGKPILIDFNLSSRRALKQGVTGGTLVYMAPEQFSALLDEDDHNDEAVNHAGDVFSLGVTLFESLTGHLPFGDAPDLRSAGTIFHTPNLKETMRDYRAQQQSARVSIREDFPQLPTVLADTLQQCLALNPAERPSLTEVSTKLRGLLAEPKNAAEKAVNRRRLILTGSLAVAAAVVAVVPFFSGLFGSETQSLREKVTEAFEEENFKRADEILTQLAKTETLTADDLAQHGVAKLGRAQDESIPDVKTRYASTAIRKLEQAIQAGFKNVNLLMGHIGRCRMIMNRNRPVDPSVTQQFKGLTVERAIVELKNTLIATRDVRRAADLTIVDYATFEWPKNADIRALATICYAGAFPTNKQKSPTQDHINRFYEHYWCLFELRNDMRSPFPAIKNMKPDFTVFCHAIRTHPEFRHLLNRGNVDLPEVRDPLK